MASEQDELSSAIDGLYDAFAGHVRPEWIDVCSCCWSGPLREPEQNPETRQKVRAVSPGRGRPLREIPAEELADVACNVPLTCGTIADFQHYLPRIFEIGVHEGFDMTDLEIVLSRLGEKEELGGSPWTTWPEAPAVRRFLHALWRDRLSAADEFGRGYDEVLTGVGNTDPDIDWYLAEWLRFEHPYAAFHLSAFLQENVTVIEHAKLMNPFWHADRSPACENLARIAEWSCAATTKEAVALAADRARSPEERETLTEIYLRWLPTGA